MVAASRMRGARVRAADAPALLRRIAELERQIEEQRPQQPTQGKGRKLIFGQPFIFDGSRDDQKVITWLSKVDTQIRMNERAFGEPLEDEDKILIAESHLGETPLRQYNVKIEQDGRFTTYDDFTEWIRDFYAPSDLLAYYRQQYRRCRQGKEETVDSYYLRFTEIVAKLDEKPRISWQVSDFVNGLQSKYSEMLQQYEDMSNFKAVTMNDVLKRLNRSARLAGNRNTANDKVVEQRVSSNSKRSFKSKKPIMNSKETPAAEKLTSDQKRRVERLIEAGGGKFVGKDIKNVREWVELSQAKGVCRNCAAKGHFSRDCSLKKPKNSGKSQLNALITDALDSEIQQDSDYLCSIAEKPSLLMFPCSIDHTPGIVMPDTRATRNYVSQSYAKRAGLRIQETAVRSVRVPNGHAMKVYGTTTFILQIGEWRGKVQAIVLDLKADFDVILGLQWFIKWKPIPNWDKLEFVIETADGAKRIGRSFHIPDLKELDDEELDQLNLITEKELRRELKQGCHMVLYFAKASEESDGDTQLAAENCKPRATTIA